MVNETPKSKDWERTSLPLYLAYYWTCLWANTRQCCVCATAILLQPPKISTITYCIHKIQDLEEFGKTLNNLILFLFRLIDGCLLDIFSLHTLRYVAVIAWLWLIQSKKTMYPPLPKTTIYSTTYEVVEAARMGAREKEV